ncbi:MAG: GNAT family N-acetyltransferase [Armatimonadota bacterium]
MHRILGSTDLRSGEKAELWKITAPDPTWADRLLGFLVHKGEPWLWAMREGLTGGLQDLTMNFYECVVEDEVVGNITVLENLSRPVGLLQHVFTLPEHRRKGVASALMAALCYDFRLRGGRAMFLGTGYRTPPFWIYYGFGFRPIGETGHMRWLPQEDFVEDYFSPGPISVRNTRWGDWPLLEALYASTEDWVVRSTRLRLYGQKSFEGPFLTLMQALYERRIRQSLVMTKPDGAVVGHATVWVIKEVPGEPWLLELLVHPNFRNQAGEMLSHVFVPPTHKLQAHADSDAWDKHCLLRSMGLWREACFRRQVAWQGRWLDLHYYSSHWAPE